LGEGGEIIKVKFSLNMPWAKYDILLTVLATSQQLKVHATHTKNC
jgi:hypothetical protein